MLTQKQVKEMDNKALLETFIRNEDTLMAESSFNKNGATKRTCKNNELLLKELCKRLNIDEKTLDI